MRLSSWNDLVGFLHSCAARYGQKPWYRGHDDHRWDLLPHVKRDPFCFMDQAEQYMATNFRTEAKKRLQHYPTTDSGWLSLMQHYGLPTRLLDWSESPLVALYFAVMDRESTQHDAALWCLNPTALNAHQSKDRKMDYVFPMDYQTVLDIIVPAFIPTDPSNRVIACSSVENDLRMYVQQSAFTVHDCDTPLNCLPYAEHVLSKAIIPKDAKPFFRHTLELMGFSLGTVFPDIEHIATEQKEIYFSLSMLEKSRKG